MTTEVTLASGFPNIVLTGKMHAGKTTIRNYLTDVIGGYQHVSFAKKLKEICDELFVNPGREEYQQLGQDVRDIDMDAWARIGATHAELVNAVRGVPFVCDDCRYPNEVEMLKSLPQRAVFIHVQASRAVRLNRLRETGRFENEYQLDAVSEIALDDYPSYWPNHLILNENLSKLELFDEVNQILDIERRK